VPKDKLRKDLQKLANAKAPYVFMIVYDRTMEKYKDATIDDFATELSKVMAKFELRNQQYLESKSSSDDKFARLNNILGLYTEAKAYGRVSKANKVFLRVSGLKAHTIGEYSIDLRFGNNDRVVATNVKVNDAKVESTIVNKPPFECEVSERLANFSVSLYDTAGDQVSEGNSWMFQGFSRAEPFPLKETLECTSSTM
jgi:hypothetical protein